MVSWDGDYRCGSLGRVGMIGHGLIAQSTPYPLTLRSLNMRRCCLLAALAAALIALAADDALAFGRRGRSRGCCAMPVCCPAPCPPPVSTCDCAAGFNATAAVPEAAPAA